MSHNNATAWCYYTIWIEEYNKINCLMDINKKKEKKGNFLYNFSGR